MSSTYDFIIFLQTWLYSWVGWISWAEREGEVKKEKIIQNFGKQCNAPCGHRSINSRIGAVNRSCVAVRYFHASSVHNIIAQGSLFKAQSLQIKPFPESPQYLSVLHPCFFKIMVIINYWDSNF